MNVVIVVINCQKCNERLNGYKQVSWIAFCPFFGSGLVSPHSDQMSQRSQFCRSALWYCFSKVSASQSVTKSVCLNPFWYVGPSVEGSVNYQTFSHILCTFFQVPSRFEILILQTCKKGHVAHKYLYFVGDVLCVLGVGGAKPATFLLQPFLVREVRVD